MGEGLFVHASNSLGVISIAWSVIVPFEERGGKKLWSAQHCNTSSQVGKTQRGGEKLFDLSCRHF